MARRSKPSAFDSEANVAEHVRVEREERGWSTSELAKRVTDAGCPISQSAIWRIENGEPRRKISVDELIAFGKVFDMTIVDLLEPRVTDFPVKELEAKIQSWIDFQDEILAAQEKINNAQTSINEIFEEMAVHLFHNPELESAIEEMLRIEVAAHDVLSIVADELVEQFRTSVLRLTRRGPAPQSIAIRGLRQGLSYPEILEEAERLGRLNAVKKILEGGTAVIVDTETGRVERVPLDSFRPTSTGGE